MATDERDTQREVICQEDVVKHRIDKLCQEIAERHYLTQKCDCKQCSNSETEKRALAALREAYDKGHDAGARAQQEKDAREHELTASNLSGVYTFLTGVSDHHAQVVGEAIEAHERTAAAIRAGRE